MSVIVRTIGIEGAALLAVIHREAFEAEGEVWDETSLKRLLLLSGVTAWIALRGTEPLGFLLVRTVLDESEVLTVAVRPSEQGRGIGGLLFNYFFNIVSSEVRFIYLEVSIANKGAIDFYRKHDFQEIGRRPGYYSDGTEAMVLRRSI